MGNDVTGGAYGLTANPSGSFNGSAMTLFYGPSTWPSLSATRNPDATPCWAKHGPGCTWDQSKIWANVTVTANGGVPQAGDIGVHKAAVAELVKAKIPDPDFVRPTPTHPPPQLSPGGVALLTVAAPGRDRDIRLGVVARAVQRELRLALLLQLLQHSPRQEA